MSVKYTTRECHEMLLHVLGDLVVFGPKDRNLGICGNMVRMIESQHPDVAFSSLCLSAMKDLWVQWSEYSGERDYPVPYPSTSAESKFYHTDDMWEGAYGEKRWALVEYLIGALKEELGFTPKDDTTTHCVAPVYSD